MTNATPELPSGAERLVAAILDYAIYMLTPSGHVATWNAGAQRFKGYTANEIIGQHFSTFHTPEDRAAGIPNQALQIAHSQGKFECEGWRMRKDGSRFWASVVVDPIYGDDGALLGFAKITRDITDKKRAADELVASSKALERAREELFQSQKLEAIGQVTGGVAHDFNNLLSIISSGVQVLEAQGLAASQKTVLDSIQRAVARGSALTQQLLAFARQQPLSPSVNDVNRIIGGFETVLRRGVNASVELHVSLGADLHWVNIDEARLEATLLNLLVNARDAMPEGGSLSLSTANVTVTPDAQGEHQGMAPGEYVRIALRDTGTGMTPEVLARACEPFFTTKPIGKGTGLGLSQVQGFILQSGGALRVDSVLGEGTTVSIFLPAADGDDVPTNAQAQTEVALIVEDEEELGKLAGSLFETLGYEVILACNGDEALRALRDRGPIDVLFSDVMMPGITGIELARQARQIMPDLRVILASGYPQPAVREHGSIDEFAFISKPYRLSEIVKKLR